MAQILCCLGEKLSWTVRTVLERLGAATIRRMFRERGFSGLRSQSDQTDTLVRSFRGDIGAIISSLDKAELIELLGAEPFEGDDGFTYVLQGLSRAKKEELEGTARILFSDEWSPADDGLVPGCSVIRVKITDWGEEDINESDEFEHSDEDGDDEGDDPSERGSRPSPRGDDAFWSSLAYRGGPAPRSYQVRAAREISEALSPKAPTAIEVATGGGKTFIANLVVAAFVKAGGWVLWVTKDWELLHQAARDLCGRNEGFIDKVHRLGGDRELLSPLPESKPTGVTYTTLQTFQNQKYFLRESPTLIVWDECHWADGAILGDDLLDWARARGVRVLGLTATPKESGSFRICFRKTFHELVEEGFLAEPVYEGAIQTGTAWAARKLRDGFDFDQGSLAELAQSRRRNEFIVDTFARDSRKYGKTLVFACNIAHADALAEMFTRRAGAPARVIHSEIPRADRDECLEQFRKGNVQVLINVAMMTHGVDIPSIKTVFLCRPTLSRILYSQMIGRAARRDAGKANFHIVDFIDHSEFQAELMTSKKFFAGMFPRPQETPKPVPPRAQPPASRRPGGIGSHLTFDKHGKPTWIPDSPDVPEALRGLWYREGQTFGIEFELTKDGFSPEMSDDEWLSIAEPLRRILANTLPSGTVAKEALPAYASSSANKNYGVWNVERDNSCGWEVTSRVLRNEQGFAEGAAACLALQEAAEALGLKVNHRTGLHIHIGWMDGYVGEVRRAIQLAKVFEPALATLVAPSRIAAFQHGAYDLKQPNVYCQPVSTVFPRRAVEEAKTKDQIFRQVTDPDNRYATFNIRPLENINTVEVRMHNGTLEGDKVLLWLSLWMQILHGASITYGGPILGPDDVDRIVPDGDILELAERYLPPVQQPLFLRRLVRRREEVAALWREHPQLASSGYMQREWLEGSRRRYGQSLAGLDESDERTLD